jgi:hypothetical protein
MEKWFHYIPWSGTYEVEGDTLFTELSPGESNTIVKLLGFTPVKKWKIGNKKLIHNKVWNGKRRLPVYANVADTTIRQLLGHIVLDGDGKIKPAYYSRIISKMGEIIGDDFTPKADTLMYTSLYILNALVYKDHLIGNVTFSNKPNFR